MISPSASSDNRQRFLLGEHKGLELVGLFHIVGAQSPGVLSKF